MATSVIKRESANPVSGDSLVTITNDSFECIVHFDRIGSIGFLSITSGVTQKDLANWTLLGNVKSQAIPLRAVTLTSNGGGQIYIGTNGEIRTLGVFPMSNSFATSATYLCR